MRRKMTRNELKELFKAVLNDCIFIKRQDNIYDALDIADECKEMIKEATTEFIISVPVELFLIKKVDDAFNNNF